MCIRKDKSLCGLKQIHRLDAAKNGVRNDNDESAAAREGVGLAGRRRRREKRVAGTTGSRASANGDNWCEFPPEG